MKTLLIVTIASIFSFGYPTITLAEMRAESKSATGAKSLVQRLKESILPGLNKSSKGPYNYLTPPSKPNHFRVPFKGGQGRIYTKDEYSPLIMDPYSPEGNIFEFRF